MRPARLAILLWALLLAAAWIALASREGSPAERIAALLAGAGEGPGAATALLVAYAARSLLFLPMTVLTVFAGFLLGPAWGVVVALAGTVGSATASYGLARWARGAAFAPPADATEAPGRLAALRSRPFETVLVARLAAVPGDVVNVLAGAWRVPLAAFAAGTALGGAPGVLAGVFAGAAIEGPFAWTGLTLRPWLVAASVAMLVVSLAASALVRRRERRPARTARDG